VNAAARLLAAFACATVGAFLAAPAVARLLAWLVEPALAWLVAPMSLLECGVMVLEGETVVAVRVALERYAVVGGVVAPPGLAITASTLAAHAMLPLVAVASAALAWRGPLAARMAGACAGLALALCVAWLDLTLTLGGAVANTLAEAVGIPAGAWPGALPQVMLAGGRLALAAAAAGVTLLVARAEAARRHARVSDAGLHETATAG